MSRKTVVVNQPLATSSSFTVNLQQQQIGFDPKYVIIRQLLYCNVAGADAGTFDLERFSG